MEPSIGSRRRRLHEIIFEADTPLGKAFDVVLMLSIVASVSVVMVDSVEWIHEKHGTLLWYLEWVFTILFTIEYLLRLYCIGRPWKYATSFFGIVDLLAVLPTYLSLAFPGTQYLIVIRILRVLRVFRVLKLVNHLTAAQELLRAVVQTRLKITVFLYTVVTLVVVLGSMMYLIEGEESGFTSIPKGVYWAIVTLTTVGYGDISPRTPIGQLFASVVMILGYAIIAVPTGIVTAQMVSRRVSTQCCRDCGREGHEPDAKFCKFCGIELNPPTE